jgi:hypothetical protein
MVYGRGKGIGIGRGIEAARALAATANLSAVLGTFKPDLPPLPEGAQSQPYALRGSGRSQQCQMLAIRHGIGAFSP